MAMLTFLKDLWNGKDRMPSLLELADMGLSSADYDQLISSAEGTRERMEVLAARFGVTPAMIDANRGIALELAETCGHCGQTKACQRAIDNGEEFDTNLCPNASVYKDMSAT